MVILFKVHYLLEYGPSIDMQYDVLKIGVLLTSHAIHDIIHSADETVLGIYN